MMSKGWVTAYRIIGIFVGLFSYYLLFNLVYVVMSGMDSFLFIVTLFIAACMAIYATIMNMFGRQVMVRQQPIRLSLIDWIKINGFITLFANGFMAFCFLIIVCNRNLLETALKQHPEMSGQISLKDPAVWAALNVGLALCTLTVIHSAWTLFGVMKRYHAYFK